MERTLWTDARMDDAIARLDQRFDQMDRNFDRMWSEFDRVWEEFRTLRTEQAAWTRQLAQIGWALVGILLVQLIAALVAFS